jgi:hypothetical protein
VANLQGSNKKISLGNIGIKKGVFENNTLGGILDDGADSRRPHQ